MEYFKNLFGGNNGGLAYTLVIMVMALILPVTEAIPTPTAMLQMLLQR